MKERSACRALFAGPIFRRQSSMQAYACILITVIMFEHIVIPLVEAQLEYGYYFGKRARKRRKRRIRRRQKSRRKAVRRGMGKCETFCSFFSVWYLAHMFAPNKGNAFWDISLQIAVIRTSLFRVMPKKECSRSVPLIYSVMIV